MTTSDLALSCPAVLVSAPASNQGKTLVAAALARHWKKQGLRVRAFKCGPDFLDPMILETATGQPVLNIDLAMCGEEDARARLFQAAQESDVIVLEGVMGLFDGKPSSADIAERFGIPVALVVNASGMAQTFGALVAGLASQRPGLQLAGAIGNRIGSASHAGILEESLPDDIAWLGALPSDSAFSLPERHLGLFMAAEIDDLETRIDAASEALSNGLPIPLPPAVTFQAPATQVPPALLAGKTIAVARDEAFCFIYPANLECLEAMGASLAFFSLLHDHALPSADAIWLPGGYPELHASLITQNHGMASALKQAAASGTPILAECGGMMSLTSAIGEHAAFDVLPGAIQMTPKLKGLGIQFADLPQGRIHAHTFHYSALETAMEPLAHATTQRGKPGEAIYRHGSITATYLHFYFPSNPSAAAALLSRHA